MVYCLFWSFIICVALWCCIRWTSTETRWRRCPRQHFQIFDLIFPNTLQSYLSRTNISFQTDWSFVWHRVLRLKSQSYHLSWMVLSRLNRLTSNSNILLFFESYHWPFYLDWLFKIRNTSWFFQNLVWGLVYIFSVGWLLIWLQTLFAIFANSAFFQ